ncbi:hypothetical protein OHA98_38605 [Streptomyces sp. NBC_00654]|uniref:hypothetical protein n=1 Tax=Streptomyces sp. NBC_00654 TaxID=2975799 RepID=UPI00224DBCA3|nr:hypothetical protein [Streptomyces sp. NBC_00654]MCX4970561.1 hypothetical protein [Streptomyces sp. NBC_00654]
MSQEHRAATGRYRSYFIHPYFAGYSDMEEMEEALRNAIEAIKAGELAEPALPTPPKRHLAAVPTRRTV